MITYSQFVEWCRSKHVINKIYLNNYEQGNPLPLCKRLKVYGRDVFYSFSWSGDARFWRNIDREFRIMYDALETN